MKRRRLIIAQHVVLVALMLIVSCDKFNYVDELQGIGKRVEVLETMELQVNEGLVALKEIIQAVEDNGYVTKVKPGKDGSYEITFSTGETVTLHQGQDGKDGRDGQGALLDMGVKKGDDGIYYWTLNGEPLLDEDGEPVLAGAVDGKNGLDGRDGKNGRDGKDAAEVGAVVPQTRINPNTRHWEISADGGKTWTDTGCSADGKNGADGLNGLNGLDGADDIFLRVDQAPDGQSITFTLRDGRTFTVPIL